MHMYVSDGLINPQLSGFGSNLTLYVNQHAGKITLWAERVILLSHKSELLRRERRIMEFFLVPLTRKPYTHGHIKRGFQMKTENSFRK